MDSHSNWKIGVDNRQKWTSELKTFVVDSLGEILKDYNLSAYLYHPKPDFPYGLVHFFLLFKTDDALSDFLTVDGDKKFKTACHAATSAILIASGAPENIMICLLYTSPSPRDA